MPSNRSPAVYFDEIFRAALRLQHYVAGVSYLDFEKDQQKQDSVYYRLLVLSEAARRLTAEDHQLCPGPSWRNIRDLGNVLRHADDAIDLQTVWDILHHDLPPLKEAVEQTLRENFPEARDV